MDSKEELDNIRKNSTCLADRVLNYYQFACKKENIPQNKGVIEVYKNMRVDGILGDGRDPRGMAAAMFYVTAWKHKNKDGYMGLTQKYCAEVLGIGVQNIRKQFLAFRQNQAKTL